MEKYAAERDPLRASSEKLRVELEHEPGEGKLPKAERELLAYLVLHPGSHNLGDVEAQVRNASQAARSLARKRIGDADAGTGVAMPRVPFARRTS